jgi:hypothetical protein
MMLYVSSQREKMDKIDLIKILEGDISHIDAVNVQDIASYETRVIIKPAHVRRMLLDFLASKYTAKDLKKWATFICARTEYGCENYLDDQVADYYEDMFYIIQCLSTPEIDGEINEKQVQLYLFELKKYFT